MSVGTYFWLMNCGKPRKARCSIPSGGCVYSDQGNYKSMKECVDSCDEQK